MKIRTDLGFEVTVADDAAETLSDIETFEKLVKLDRGDPRDLPELLTAIFGEEGKQALYGSLREKFGRAKTKDVLAVFGEVVPKISETTKK